MVMAQLFLIRHAQASFGADDYDLLSELGHQQSELLGQYLNARSIEFDCLMTGNMVRHLQTANGILKHVKVDEQRIHNGWDEFDFDSLVKAFLSTYPQHQVAPNAPRSAWYKVLKMAMQAWSEENINISAESFTDFKERVNTAAQSVIDSPFKHVGVVSSGGAIAMFMMRLFNLPVEQAIGLNLQIKNTSVSQLFFNPKGFQLHSFNHVPHLDRAEHLDKITYS